MQNLSIGEVEELTGLKASVIRYWEAYIPVLNPRKSKGGLRIYTNRDLDLILRLKYLIYEKRFTVEGAGKQILHEMGSYDEHAEILNTIREIRADITQLYQIVHKNR